MIVRLPLALLRGLRKERKRKGALVSIDGTFAVASASEQQVGRANAKTTLALGETIRTAA